MKIRRKRKKYIKVLAPKLFDHKEIGYILADNVENVVGRTLEVPLYHLTSNPLHMYIKCKLFIDRVNGETAYTRYYGHQYYREFVRSLFMRGTSYIDVYKDLRINGDRTYRLTVGIFTPKRVSTSRKKAIRKNVMEALDKWMNSDEDTFLKEAIYGVIDNYISNVSRKVYPIRWCGIIKIKAVN
jgi:small subunit ribosomal protein S3Ae